jgi:hypothetical protein
MEPTMTKRTECTADEAADYFRYLDDLRESGATNMFGARPYLAAEFGLDRDLSTAVHTAWMETFDGKSSLAERAARAFKS